MDIEIINNEVPPMTSDGKYAIEYELIEPSGKSVWWKSFDGSIYDAIILGISANEQPVTTISVYGEIKDKSVLAAVATHGWPLERCGKQMNFSALDNALNGILKSITDLESALDVAIKLWLMNEHESDRIKGQMILKAYRQAIDIYMRIAT